MNVPLHHHRVPKFALTSQLVSSVSAILDIKSVKKTLTIAKMLTNAWINLAVRYAETLVVLTIAVVIKTMSYISTRNPAEPIQPSKLP